MSINNIYYLAAIKINYMNKEDNLKGLNNSPFNHVKSMDALSILKATKNISIQNPVTMGGPGIGLPQWSNAPVSTADFKTEADPLDVVLTKLLLRSAQMVEESRKLVEEIQKINGLLSKEKEVVKRRKLNIKK